MLLSYNDSLEVSEIVSDYVILPIRSGCLVPIAIGATVLVISLFAINSVRRR